MMSIQSFFEGKRILITGHTGFKGSWLTHILIGFRAKVYGYALEPTTSLNIFEKLDLDNSMTSEFGDIRDFQKFSRFYDYAKPDIIFHLAAQPLVRLSYLEPLETFSTNILGTVHLLEKIREDKRVKACVVVTTDKVYENRKTIEGYVESDNLGGEDPYSASKVCAEFVTKSYIKSFFATSNVAVATARAGNVIGGGDYAKDRIIPDCIRASRNKNPIIVRNPDSIRPWQHVLEPLNGYLLLAKELAQIGKSLDSSYNFGPDNNDNITTGELTTAFCQSWGEGITWEHKPESTAPKETHILRLDNTKAKKHLGWTPKLSVENAVKLVVEWEKDSDKAARTKMQIQEYYKK